VSYPSNWTRTKFCEIAKRKSVRINNPKESGYERYVGLEHLDSGELVVKRWGSSNDVSSSMQLFSKNDILFARRNTYLRRVSVALFDGVCSGDIIVIEPILKNIVDGFLPIFMQFEEIENRIIAWSAGAFSKRVKWKQLGDFEVWLPPKEEQKKIVDIIWSIQFNQEKTERLIQVSDKLKNGLLEDLLTKGIGHKEFKKTELGLIPKEWEILPFSKGILVNPSRKLKVGSEYTKVEMADIDEWNPRIRHFEKKLYNGGGSKFRNGDILLARITPCLENGKTVFVDILEEDECGFGSTEFIVLSGREGLTLSKFVYYLCTSSTFRQLAIDSMTGTTGRQRVPNDLFDAIKIPLPPISEQRKIVNVLDNFTAFSTEYNSLLNNLKKLKKKITNSFLSGELLIPEEAPN